MLNHIIVMGRLTRDPELRHTQTGVAVASFSIACDRDFKDKATGDRLHRRHSLAERRRVCEQVFHQGPHGCGFRPLAGTGLDGQRRQQAPLR